MTDTLKSLRQKKGMTQSEAARLFKVSLRSYKDYENDPGKRDSIKYIFMFNEMAELTKVDEEHGILSVDEIREKCEKVFQEYEVKSCYLFGSYAKGKATEKSDIDLLIVSELRGLKYFGMIERLRDELKKKLDVLDIAQLNNNQELLKDILTEGIKIYG